MITNTYEARNGRDQIHIWGGGNDNWQNLSFLGITGFSHGHHTRGGGGQDVFNFRNLHEVRDVVVGRIEDFDPSRDEIRIEGVRLDLADLPGHVRIVAYDGEHNDPGTTPQQWLLIDTGPGYVFYALEGARIDMTGNGGANGGEHERHFLDQPPDFSRLRDVAYVDPVNFVPLGYSPAPGGVLVNDTDDTLADVLTVIRGSEQGDVIAAGINDDVVQAGGGDDVVWGGSDHDSLDGGGGNDSLMGGSGNDTLFGDQGTDVLRGDMGHDRLDGSSGDDSLRGGSGNDVVFGGWGNDSLFGDAGGDLMYGGKGNDYVAGGLGADHLIFKQGDGNDRISGFEDNVDRLDLTDHGFASAAAIPRWMEGTTLVLDLGAGDLLRIYGMTFEQIRDDILL